MTTQSDHLWYVDAWTPGDRFHKARRHTGLDQGDFAELIGASRQTVSNYESDTTRRPIRAIVGAWALATGTTPDWLLRGEVPATTPGDGATETLERATGEYLRASERRLTLLPSPRPEPVAPWSEQEAA